jgi:hypothetical protein
VWVNRNLNKLVLELDNLRIIDQSRDNSDGTVKRLQAGRQRTAGTKDSPLRQSFQNRCAVHRDFCSPEYGRVRSPRTKRPRLEAHY